MRLDWVASRSEVKQDGIIRRGMTHRSPTTVSQLRNQERRYGTPAPTPPTTHGQDCGNRYVHVDRTVSVEDGRYEGSFVGGPKGAAGVGR